MDSKSLLILQKYSNASVGMPKYGQVYNCSAFRPTIEQTYQIVYVVDQTFGYYLVPVRARLIKCHKYFTTETRKKKT